jgi:hypothetical protein
MELFLAAAMSLAISAGSVDYNVYNGAGSTDGGDGGGGNWTSNVPELTNELAAGEKKLSILEQFFELRGAGAS